MRKGLDQVTLARVYRAVSGRYDIQHALLTARADERGRRMVVNATVREGDRVLDFGSGTGSTALLAAARVGSAGKVIALDMSRSMLNIAVEKARALGIQDRISFVAGDILQLPFPENSFDVVLSTYSMCPLYDPEQGAMELYRRVKPSGRLGIAHSAGPTGRWIQWMADVVETIVWRFPSISLGCRSVSVLPALRKVGAVTLLDRMIGVPLWPFQIFVVEKPATAFTV